LLAVVPLLWLSLGGGKVLRLLLLSLPAAMIGVYLVYNRTVVGSFLPTSGAVKAGFALSRNWSYILMVLLPSKGSWVTMTSDYTVSFVEVAFRVFEMLVPTVVAAVFVVRQRRAFDLNAALALGVALKGLYNLLFVPLINQGYWYYGSSLLIANLILAMWLDRKDSTSLPAATRPAWVFLTGCFLLISFSFNAQVYSRLPTGEWATALLSRKDSIRSLIESSGGDRFIEMNDGEITYVTGLPALAGTGLALDIEATKALKTGHFLELASRRGYHLMVAAGAYRPAVDDYFSMRARGFRGTLNQIQATEFDHFNVVPVAHDNVTDLTVYRLDAVR